MSKIKKAERTEDINADLFFSTDCKILYQKNDKKNAILIATRKFFQI